MKIKSQEVLTNQVRISKNYLIKVEKDGKEHLIEMNIWKMDSNCTYDDGWIFLSGEKFYHSLEKEEQDQFDDFIRTLDF